MIKVQMTDDIRKYETKIIGPFTGRQATCVGIGLVVGFVIASLIPTTWDNKLVIALFLAMPIWICGWIKVSDTPLEIFIIRIIYTFVLTPTKRKYKVKHWLKEDIEKYDKKVEKARLSKMSSSEQKKYKNKKANKVIKYSKKKEYKVYT